MQAPEEVKSFKSLESPQNKILGWIVTPMVTMVADAWLCAPRWFSLSQRSPKEHERTPPPNTVRIDSAPSDILVFTASASNF